eukprot:SAG22_NODE_21389_length_257_cov_0.968354_1_plen_58_part_01
MAALLMLAVLSALPVTCAALAGAEPATASAWQVERGGTHVRVTGPGHYDSSAAANCTT